MITHFGVIHFSGDPDGQHEAEDLRGMPPRLEMIAAGSEEFCWKALGEWLQKHPLREWEHAEVLKRDPALVGVV